MFRPKIKTKSPVKKLEQMALSMSVLRKIETILWILTKWTKAKSVNSKSEFGRHKPAKQWIHAKVGTQIFVFRVFITYFHCEWQCPGAACGLQTKQKRCRKHLKISVQKFCFDKVHSHQKKCFGSNHFIAKIISE